MAEIKISELSIGDWVRNSKGTNLRIIEIPWNCIVTRHKGIEHALRFSSIHPIPLTPEILEKNGFIDYEVGKGWYVLNVADDLRVWLHRNSHDWTFQLMKWSPLSTHEIGKVFIKHTHQLQHALRLAGVAKEIEV